MSFLRKHRWWVLGTLVVLMIVTGWYAYRNPVSGRIPVILSFAGLLIWPVLIVAWHRAKMGWQLTAGGVLIVIGHLCRLFGISENASANLPWIQASAVLTTVALILLTWGLVRYRMRGGRNYFF